LQVPVAHWMSVVHATPGVSFVTQVPVPSQYSVLKHVSRSCPLVTDTHAPVPTVHVMHEPPHAPAQQTPSSQTPEVHCAFDVQLAPGVVCGRQLPLLLQ
jgi:hypothetical protein